MRWRGYEYKRQKPCIPDQVEGDRLRERASLRERVAFSIMCPVVFAPRDETGTIMITPQTITEYVRQVLADAQVTVTDRTGTMDHLNVRVVSDGFKGKNLLDRHRLIYQALDGPLKDGRIHALELTTETTDGS